MTDTASRACSRRAGRLGRAVGGAAVVVVLVVGGAAPAGADPTRSMSIDPTGDVTSSPVATGTFTGASLLGLSVEQITAIDLRVSPTGPTGGSKVSQDGCEVASAGACGTGTVTFAWDIPALAYNGPYLVEASARYCDPLSLCGKDAKSVSATPIPFRLAVDPKAPTDLKLSAGAERSVVVSWARNPEPDILYYALFRKDPGGDFRRLGSDIKQPSSGRPTFTDTSAAATNGGDFVYKVFAVRPGFSGDDSTTKISSASTERTTTVAPPPTTTTPPGDPAGGPVTTVAGQGVDIGSFLSGQAPTLGSPAPIFLDLPDTGFGETLPFGSLPADEAEPGEQDAVLPTPRQRQVADFKRNRPLIPVAAGAILLVLAGHIRLLNVRTKAAPEKPPPGTYVARALEAARASSGVSVIPSPPTAIPKAVATAVANGGHHRAPPDDDVAGLPVWAEFEPVSALGLLDAPEDREFVRPALPGSTAPPQVPVWAEFDPVWALGLLDAPEPRPAAAQPPPPPPTLPPTPMPQPQSVAQPLPQPQPAAPPVPVMALVEPEPFFAPEPDSAPRPAVADPDSEWSSPPEVFVGPRR